MSASARVTGPAAIFGSSLTFGSVVNLAGARLGIVMLGAFNRQLAPWLAAIDFEPGSG